MKCLNEVEPQHRNSPTSLFILLSILFMFILVPGRRCCHGDNVNMQLCVEITGSCFCLRDQKEKTETEAEHKDRL